MRIKLYRTVQQMGFMLMALCLVVLLKQSPPTNDVVASETQTFISPEEKENNDVVMREVTAYPRINAANKSTSSPPSRPTCQRNTSMADNVTGFSSLPAHIQDHLYYRHCRHFPLMLDVPDKCGGPERSKDVFLLLAIKSSPGNHDRREGLRKTWGEERLERGKQIRRLFLVGTAGSGFERQRLNRLLELEQREHGDILQWDFDDSFFNLTLKQVLFLEWLDRNCPHVHFLFNGDDDIFANTDNMVEYLLGTRNEEEGNSQHLFVGQLIRSPPVREPTNKYFVPVQVHESNSYPLYCSGGGILLSGYTASVIYNMSQSMTLHPIDDVYMGMCLAKAGLKPARHRGVMLSGMTVPSKKIDPYDPCYYRQILAVHRFLSLQMYVMWHNIRDPNIKCGSSDFTV